MGTKVTGRRLEKKRDNRSAMIEWWNWFHGPNGLNWLQWQCYETPMLSKDIKYNLYPHWNKFFFRVYSPIICTFYSNWWAFQCWLEMFKNILSCKLGQLVPQQYALPSKCTCQHIFLCTKLACQIYSTQCLLLNVMYKYKNLAFWVLCDCCTSQVHHLSHSMCKSDNSII